MSKVYLKLKKKFEDFCSGFSRILIPNIDDFIFGLHVLKALIMPYINLKPTG